MASVAAAVQQRAVQQPARAAQQPSTSGRSTLAAQRRAGLGVAALPRRSLRPRQQQLAVCSLTSHPGEVRGRAGAARQRGLRGRRVGDKREWLGRRNRPAAAPARPLPRSRQ